MYIASLSASQNIAPQAPCFGRRATLPEFDTEFYPEVNKCFTGVSLGKKRSFVYDEAEQPSIVRQLVDHEADVLDADENERHYDLFFLLKGSAAFLAELRSGILKALPTLNQDPVMTRPHLRYQAQAAVINENKTLLRFKILPAEGLHFDGPTPDEREAQQVVISGKYATHKKVPPTPEERRREQEHRQLRKSWDYFKR